MKNDDVSFSLFLGASPYTFEFARFLRRNLTDAEKRLWEVIRDRKVKNAKFRRQHPLLNYIADFYCHEARLVIELDGSIHYVPDQIELDDKRTKNLEQYGIRILRFSNREVFVDLEKVVARISDALEPPQP
ncbi:MAG: endonuclease domain-containing protein [Bacteroidota bacterium]